MGEMLRAVVRNGRIILDVSTDLPDGTELALVPLDRAADDSDEAHRAARDASLMRGLAQLRAGETVSAKAVMDRLNGKRQAS